MFRHLQTYPLYLVLLLVTACESYDFTVNEKLVYTPKPLFSSFETPDTALQQCLEQAIIDAKVTSASELAALGCSHAGITNLEGLEIFTGISRLKLSSNNIRDITPLAALTILESLHLDDNKIIDTTPLLDLPALAELDLSGNSELLCPSDSSLMTLKKLLVPAHCN